MNKYKYKYPRRPIFLHDCHIIRVDGTGAVIIIGIGGGGGDFSFDVVGVSGFGLMVVHLNEFFFLLQGQGTLNFLYIVFIVIDFIIVFIVIDFIIVFIVIDFIVFIIVGIGIVIV